MKCSTKPEKVNSKEIKVVYSPKKYSTYDHRGKFEDAHQTKAKMKCAFVQKVCCFYHSSTGAKVSSNRVINEYSTQYVSHC